MSPSPPIPVTSPEHLQQLLSTDLSQVSLLYFRADWAKPCEQMDVVVEELGRRWKEVLVLMIEAESLPDISESFEVDAVPYFILLRGHTLLSRLSGAQPSVLSSLLTTHCSPSLKPKATSTVQPSKVEGIYEGEDSEDEEGEEELRGRCEGLMRSGRVVLFMKGDRKVPRCGFSQKIIGILEGLDVEYTTFDILSDEAVRQELKKLNDWPTFPQLIIDGEFMGGLDVVQEMVENGELAEALGLTT